MQFVEGRQVRLRVELFRGGVGSGHAVMHEYR